MVAADTPSNAVLTSPPAFEALVEASSPGEARLRCLRQPPVFVEDTSWIMKHCTSFITARAIMDATVKLLVEQEKCCGGEGRPDPDRGRGDSGEEETGGRR